MVLHCNSLDNGLYTIVTNDNTAKGRMLVKH